MFMRTSPIYVTVGGKRARSPEDAKYFVAWIERISTHSKISGLEFAAEKRSMCWGD